jgi:AbrB family looped-hinge helix DNA binding protein
LLVSLLTASGGNGEWKGASLPAEVRRRLHLAPGDKVLFVEKPNGEVVVARLG